MMTFSSKQLEEIRNRPRGARYFIEGGFGCVGSGRYLKAASALIEQFNELVHNQQRHSFFGNHKVVIVGVGTVFSHVDGCLQIELYHKEDKVDTFKVLYLDIGDTYRYWLPNVLHSRGSTIEQVFNRLTENVKAPVVVTD